MSDLRSAPVPPPRPDDHIRGPEDAPLLVMYADFACPRCALAHERLRDQPVRLVFRHLALKAKHARAVPLARAAEAAAAQGAFWPMHDALFGDPGHLDDPHLWARCERLGLDLERFEADRRSPAVAERIARDVRDALRAGATATPTLFHEGVLHAGPPDAELIARLGLPATMVGFGFREEANAPADRRAGRKGNAYEQ
jgi:protein-disulfide isomerase